MSTDIPDTDTAADTGQFTIVDEYLSVLDELVEKSRSAEHVALEQRPEQMPAVAAILTVGRIIEEYLAIPDDDEHQAAHSVMPRATAFKPAQIVLKGRQAVSVLNEVCQQRGWEKPNYEVGSKAVGDSLLFGGNLKVGELTVSIGPNLSTKKNAKAALARQMLKEHFGAVDDYPDDEEA